MLLLGDPIHEPCRISKALSLKPSEMPHDGGSKSSLVLVLFQKNLVVETNKGKRNSRSRKKKVVQLVVSRTSKQFGTFQLIPRRSGVVRNTLSSNFQCRKRQAKEGSLSEEQHVHLCSGSIFYRCIVFDANYGHVSWYQASKNNNKIRNTSI